MIKILQRVILVSVLLISGISVSAQRFDRGINRGIFVPKGQWLTGGAMSFSQYGYDDYKFLIADDMNGSGYTMNISPFIGYFFKDNVAAGARFGYKRTSIDINGIKIKLGDDLSIEVNDYSNIQHVYYGTAMMRNYLNLGNSKRFGLYNEVRLTFGGGQGKMLSGTGDELTGTYQDIYELQLGLAPGLAAFITNEVAVEVSVGVLGLNIRKVKQVSDQIYQGTYTTSSANFKFDLFSINLGIAFYIPTLKPSFKSKLNRSKIN